jgi:hypothetical protein
MPVELLRDQRGIYGIGVSDMFDIHALAWACGIDPCSSDPNPGYLIVRPDIARLAKAQYDQFAVLQKITGGFRHGMFCHSIEEALRRVIHHEALRRAGLPWPSPERRTKPYWSTDAKQQARNQQIYHGLRLWSLSIINRLIGRLIEEAADADAIKMARRFAFRYREEIYRAGVRSRRAQQLAETFPWLALSIYTTCPGDRLANNQLIEQRRAARALVERGARLRDVAAIMQTPMELRNVNPGGAHLLSDTFCRHPELVLAFMPDSLPLTRIWLRAVRDAEIRAGDEYAVWAAKWASKIPVGSPEEVLSILRDIGDWVRASHDGQRFIVRPFAPTMSLRTVTRLSAEWHEAVANHIEGPEYVFPTPWYPATKLNGGYEIVPVENSAELYREGAAMHHCVGTYANEVRNGFSYIYSVRRGGERVATAQFDRFDKGVVCNQVMLRQIRGHCNAQVPKEIVTTVQRWLRAQAPLPPVGEATKSLPANQVDGHAQDFPPIHFMESDASTKTA